MTETHPSTPDRASPSVGSPSVGSASGANAAGLPVARRARRPEQAVFALGVTIASFVGVVLLPPPMLLLALMVLPLVFAAGLLFRPAGLAKWWALGGTSVNLFVSLLLLGEFVFGRGETFQAGASVPWLPELGLSFSIGVDSVSMLLIGLTALLGPVCVLGSWTAIRERRRLFYGWLLVLQTAMVGVFAARDLLVFYICFEFTLLPMFVLINEFGSSNRKKAAIKFFLYTFTGSLIALAGLIYVAAQVGRAVGGFTLDLEVITEWAPTVLSTGEQAMVFFMLLAGFAVKVPLFPVHTWLPLAHTEAPTAGSVVLAGVLLKLGTYAIYRLVLPLVPAASYEYAPLIAALSVIGVVYAGLICWVQDDVKKLVAYSSVSHLGFCVLGLFALNAAGLTGGVLYMINHGLSTGALFLLIGFVYERYHTRDMRKLGGLAARMPVWSFFMVYFAMASVGLPGLNGFVSEFLCTMGAFQSYTEWAGGGPEPVSAGSTWGPLGPWFALAAGTGVIIAAIYLLTMVARMVWGTLKEPHDHHDSGHADGHPPAPKLPADLTAREITALAPLALACLVFGVVPTQTLIGAIQTQVNAQVADIRENANRAGVGLIPAAAAALEPRTGPTPKAAPSLTPGGVEPGQAESTGLAAVGAR